MTGNSGDVWERSPVPVPPPSPPDVPPSDPAPSPPDESMRPLQAAAKAGTTTRAVHLVGIGPRTDAPAGTSILQRDRGAPAHFRSWRRRPARMAAAAPAIGAPQNRGDRNAA